MKKINTLIRKYNHGEELEKNELLEVALYQVKILNPTLPQWSKWNNKAKGLIVELLQEGTEIPTNKGMRKMLFFGSNVATLCKRCNGTALDVQARDNKCSCVRGYQLNSKIKEISEEEYKRRALRKYFKDLTKKGHLSKYTQDELLNMNIDEFLYYTKVTKL